MLARCEPYGSFDHQAETAKQRVTERMNTIDDIVAEYGTEPINRAVRLFGDALIETGILMHPVSVHEIQKALNRQIDLEVSKTRQDSCAVVRVLEVVRRNLAEIPSAQSSA